MIRLSLSVHSVSISSSSWVCWTALTAWACITLSEAPDASLGPAWLGSVTGSATSPAQWPLGTSHSSQKAQSFSNAMNVKSHQSMAPCTRLTAPGTRDLLGPEEEPRFWGVHSRRPASKLRQSTPACTGFTQWCSVLFFPFCLIQREDSKLH